MSAGSNVSCRTRRSGSKCSRFQGMPLYSNFRFGTPIAKEDVRQGNVDVILPDIALEYKPNENMSFRLMFVNENDAFKAYGPYRHFYGGCPWRTSYYCR